MRGDLPKKEPELLARWADMNLFQRLRAESKGRPKFVLHDGPPYANGNLHIGHALNKILKDVVNRTQQMLGKDATTCRAGTATACRSNGRSRRSTAPRSRTRTPCRSASSAAECRAFAEHWIGVQREEFKRLGVDGDWDNHYTTMAYAAEAAIARELGKFLMNGGLYKGSKAGAVVGGREDRAGRGRDRVSRPHLRHDLGALPGRSKPTAGKLDGASVVIWTTTPWTMPGNRAHRLRRRHRLRASSRSTRWREGSRARVGEKLVLAHGAAGRGRRGGQASHAPSRWATLSGERSRRHSSPRIRCAARATTSTCRCCPATSSPPRPAPASCISRRATAPTTSSWACANGVEVPDTVGRGRHATTRRCRCSPAGVVYTSVGKKGDANRTVIEALDKAGKLLASGTLAHTYPHSWRSKAPLIFRNTPQWFIPWTGRTRICARRRWRRSTRHRFVPAAGPQPHRRA